MSDLSVPIHEKVCLTIEEASAISGIGIVAMRNLVKDDFCPFVLKVGRRYLVKKKEFVDFISRTRMI